MKKRIEAMMLVLCMLLTLLPNVALAAENNDESELKSFTVSIDNENPVSLLDRDSGPNLSMGEEYTFQLEFNRPDDIKQVYVVSTKNDEKMYLEAKDDGQGNFTTSGYFGDDENYIPGSISIEFSKNPKSIDESTIWSVLESPLSVDSVTLKTNEKDSIKGRVDLFDLIDDVGLLNNTIDFSVDVIDGLTGTDLKTWLGIYEDLTETIMDLEKGEFHIIDPDKNFDNLGSYVLILKDVSDANKYFKLILDTSGDNPKLLSDLSKELSKNKDIISLMADYVEIQDKKDDLIKQIDANPMIQDKADAYAQVEAYESDRIWFSTLTTIVPIIVAATGGTMVIPGALFTAYFSIMTSMADYFWEYRIGLIKGCEPVSGVFMGNNAHGGAIALTDDSVDELRFWFNGGSRIVKKSRNYYIPEDEVNSSARGFWIHDYEEEGPPINVSMCLHGHQTFDTKVNHSSICHIYDCKYDKSNIPKFAQKIMAREKSKIIIDTGHIDTLSAHDSSELIINGGSIYGMVMAYGNSSITVNGGTLVGRPTSIVKLGGIHIGESNAIVKDGEIEGIDNSAGIVTFTGGVVTDDGISTYAGGTTTISNGVINGGIKNSSDGSTIISDGIINGGIKNSSKGSTIISNGVINGGISNYNNGSTGATTLLINEHSDIQVSGNQAFDVTPIITTAIGYTGGITYYNSPTAQGISMSIEEISSINFKSPYVRIVATNSIGEPDSGNLGEKPEECDHSYSSIVTTPTCTERGYTTHTCNKCGNDYRDNYTNALGHHFGEWIVIKIASSTTPGSRERICSVCQYKETDTIPATGSSGSNSSSSGSSGSSSSSSSNSSTISRTVSVNSVSNGKVAVSPKSAAKGKTITVTTTPNSGYVLDSLTVKDQTGKTLDLTDKGGGVYTFTMPSGKVNVDAVFRRAEQQTSSTAPSVFFFDITDDFWAKEAIDWVSSKGYMNGYAAKTFDPNGYMTRQQLWMILARLGGETPANMAEAKAWAIRNGVSDGTNPGTSVTRQQLVTFLYRYCSLKGYPISGSGTLEAFTDRSNVSGYAQDAMAWAVGNGIVNGTTQTTLSPTGRATRAQFAVILKRFYEQVVEV